MVEITEDLTDDQLIALVAVRPVDIAEEREGEPSGRDGGRIGALGSGGQLSSEFLLVSPARLGEAG